MLKGEKIRTLVMGTLASVRRNTLAFFGKDRDCRDIRLSRLDSTFTPGAICKVKFKNTRVIEVFSTDTNLIIRMKQKKEEFCLNERYKILKVEEIPLDVDSIKSALYEAFLWGSSHPQIQSKKAKAIPLLSQDTIYHLGKDEVAYAYIMDAKPIGISGDRKVYDLQLYTTGKTHRLKLALRFPEYIVLKGRHLLIDAKGESIACSDNTVKHYLED